MSKVLADLHGDVKHGFADIAVAAPQGMITLRADLADPAVAITVNALLMLTMPAPRKMTSAGDKSAAWMSPDELLLLVPYAEVGAMVAALQSALSGHHALVVDVSDARALFRITGPKSDQVLMKLCPVDVPALPMDEMRRTRVAQVAAAFWRTDDGFALITFRSVAGYVASLLETAAREGSELFPI